MDTLVILLLTILTVFIILFIATFNNLIRRRNQVRNVLASVDALLQKRWDLIPNLVSSVKGYMEHETHLFKTVAELRAQAMAPGLDTSAKMIADSKISQALTPIMVAVERYPQLRANENVLHLQQALTEVEEQISAGRRAYNAAVTEYNNAVHMFPSNIVASLAHFSASSFFEKDPASDRNVNVSKLS